MVFMLMGDKQMWFLYENNIFIFKSIFKSAKMIFHLTQKIFSNKKHRKFSVLNAISETLCSKEISAKLLKDF